MRNSTQKSNLSDHFFLEKSKRSEEFQLKKYCYGADSPLSCNRFCHLNFWKLGKQEYFSAAIEIYVSFAHV